MKTLELNRKFDPKSCRHLNNGQVSVLHCHHYASLYSQLADDCGMLDAKKLLAEVAEDTVYQTLHDYYKANDVTDIADRVAIAEQYYAAAGMGRMKILCAGPDSGEVELTSSHVDEGWIKKWGNRDKPVNFITSGYISGAFSAIFGKLARSFAANETASIVAGAPASRFEVAAN